MKFIDSFKEIVKKKFWIITLMQIALFTLAILGTYGWSSYMGTALEQVSELDITAPDYVLAQTGAEMDNVLNVLYGTAFILLIFLVLNYTFWKWVIHANLQKTKPKHYWKFTLMTIVFLIIEIPILLLILNFTSNFAVYIAQAPNYAVATMFALLNIFIFLPIIFLVINFGELLQHFYFHEKHYIKKSWHTIKQIKKLYWPHVAIGLVFTLIVLLISFFDLYQTSHLLISVILLSIFFAWTKFYLLKVK